MVRHGYAHYVNRQVATEIYRGMGCAARPKSLGWKRREWQVLRTGPVERDSETGAPRSGETLRSASSDSPVETHLLHDQGACDFLSQ